MKTNKNRRKFSCRAIALIFFGNTSWTKASPTIKTKKNFIKINDYLSEIEKQDVASGAEYIDITKTIQSILAGGATHIDFGENLTYIIKLPETEFLGKWTGENEVHLRGKNTVIKNKTEYNLDSITPIFWFSSSSNITIEGIDYEGYELPKPEKKLGYLGATFCYLTEGCSNIDVTVNLKNCRYGVLSGGYKSPSKGNCKNINATIKSDFVGYPVALYLSEQVSLKINATNTHRACYAAGVINFKIDAKFKNQFIAPIQVLLTDATYGNGKSRGCSNGKITAIDLGSTRYEENSWCCGISLSRVDSGTQFNDIDININIVSNNTTATTIGALYIGSNARNYQPEYPYNWEETIVLNNIKLSGIINRSSQTVPANRYGDIYINTIDTQHHRATTKNIDTTGIIHTQGSLENKMKIFTTTSD